MSCRLLFTNISHIKKSDFLSALAEMERGGPDVPGCYAEYSSAKLGHNRLSILDLNPRSNQPFISSCRRFSIIYNGEVYNYRELAKEHNIIMKTSSDTELILELSIKIGFEKALKYFNGMFAYVIYNIQNGAFFVARDRLGVKPLYMYRNENGFIFSSEINAIVSLLEDNIEIDPVGKRQYKRLRGFFNGKTIYKNIEMFPAGCFMEKKKIHKWWELSLEEQEPPSDEELYSLIDSAIDYRMISDVPLGTFLSGGIDSSIVTALAAKKYNYVLHTWISGIFEDKDNEFFYGKLAARSICTQHHEVTIKREQFLQTAKEMIKKRKEPLQVPNEVILYEMCRNVKKENTVILCGEGADELFFGYDRIFRWAESCKTFDVYKFAESYSYGATDIDVDIVESVIEPFYKYGPKPINIVAAYFQTSRLHGLLRRLDNSSMMHAIETRVPFCDYRLVERLFGVPFNWKMNGGIVKAPLKRISKKIIPQEIIDREKVGFPVSLRDIFGVTQEKAFDSWINFNLSLL